MITSKLQGSDGTTGAMFDRERRRGTAVFYQTLKDAFGRDGSGAELAANYLFTAVHEVAHCLNLPHVFEAKALDGLSPKVATFMNYPQNYTGFAGSGEASTYQGFGGWDPDRLTCYRNFWSIFAYEFHPQELLELRHGARRDILTGGTDPWTGDPITPYRGDFSGAQSSLALGGPSGAGLELRLRIRGAARADGGPGGPVALFRFGEPIHVEAELRSRLKRPRPVERRLSVLTGDLQIHYQDPAGRFLTYTPPCALCYFSTPEILDGDDRSPVPDSFHKDICLNFGGNAFRFVEPGRYRIRASFRVQDTLLISDVLELFVRYPTPQDERLIVPLLDEDVAAFLSFRGVHGLPRADARLQTVFREGRPEDLVHPLFHYFCADEARLRSASVVTYNPATRRVEEGRRAADADGDALGWFARALGFTDLKDLKRRGAASLGGLPFSNIVLGKVGSCFHAALEDARESGLARQLVHRLYAALTDRGVPGSVCKRYLPPDPGPPEGSAPRRRSRRNTRGKGTG
jgi:hypothetical protein